MEHLIIDWDENPHTLHSSEIQTHFNCGSPLLFVATGFRYSWTFVGCLGVWFMAIDGAYLRNCPNFHLSRFLLLLCQKVSIVHDLALSFSLFMHSFCSSFCWECLKIFPAWLLTCPYDNCSVFGGQLVLRLPSGVVWLKICFGAVPQLLLT